MQEIMRRGEAIAVTFEGINLSSSSKGQVTLVQVGTMSGQAYLFDVITDPKIWNEGQLKAALQCNDVCKVLHDCRNISALLSEQYATKLCHVFDTQVCTTRACPHSYLFHQKSNPRVRFDTLHLSNIFMVCA